MSLSNGQPANQTTFNDAFMSRTTDTSTTGKINQTNSTDSSSPSDGALTTDGGLGVAKNLNVGGAFSASKYRALWKTYATEAISAAGTISFETYQGQQYRRVQGDGGAVTLANKPFGATITGIEDGQVFRIVGTSDANTVKIEDADVQYGFKLFGDAILAAGYILEVQYDAVLERFLEIGRNY